MPLYRILLTSLFVFMLLPQSSWARNIYLNGKLINGVRGTTFVNVTTRVDHKGDIYITGRQYKVQYKKTTAQKAKPSQAKRGLPVLAFL